MAQRFCQACGNALGENEAFCAACGAPNPVEQAPQAVVPQAAQSAVNQAVPQQNNFVDNGAVPTAQGGGAAAALKGKKNIIIIAAAALVVVIVAIVVILNLTKYQSIEAKEIIRVDFSGMDGKGTAVAVLNTDRKEYDAKKDKEETVKGSDFLVQKDDDDYKDRLLGAWTKAGSKNKAKDMQEVLMDTDKKGELKNLSIELSEEKNLKNGDTVTVTVEADEDELKEAGIKLTDTEFEVTVEGLNTLETLDVFDYAEVTFEGFDGYGEYNVTTKNDSMPEGLKRYVDFGEYEYRNDLKNGDKVKVEAYVSFNYTDEDGNRYIHLEDDDKYYDVGYKAGEDLTKEFEVTGLKELQEYDPMNDIKIEFSGTGPYTISRINKDAMTAEIADAVYFDYDWGKEYKVGDTVTIKGYAYSSLKDLGYKLKGNEDSDGYISYSVTITEDMVPVLITKTEDAKTLSDSAEALIKAELDEYVEDIKDDYKKVADPEVSKTYLTVNKKLDDYGSKTIYARIYKINVTDDSNKKSDIFLMIYGNDLVKRNGEVTFTNDYLSYTTRSKLDDYKEYWSKSDYTMSEVK